MKKQLVICVLTLMMYFLQLALSCQQGQLLINTKCVPITYIQDCKDYNEDGSCKDCQQGFKLKDGKSCSMSPYKGKYCTKRDAQGHCLKCISGLDLIGKECVKTKLVGCIKKESNNQKCAVCGTGHVLRSHKCDKNKEGCAIEDAVKGCQKCLGDYHLEGSKCVPNSIDQNCKHSTDNGCYKCKDGYYLTKDRKCVPNEPKCLFYQKTQCTLCKRVYTLKDGSCELTNCTVPGLPGTGCKVCKYPYFPYNGRCSLSYCNEVGPNDQCDVCSSGGRRIKNHKCEKEPLLECAPCTHNYIFKDGDCVESGIQSAQKLVAETAPNILVQSPSHIPATTILSPSKSVNLPVQTVPSK